MRQGIFRLLTAAVLSVTLNSAVSARQFYFQHYDIKNGLSQNTVHHILQDRPGFIWFATKDGLNRFDGTKFRRINVDNEDTDCSFIYTLFEDSTGKIWVSASHGPCIYDPYTERMSKFNGTTTDGETINTQISHITEAPDGRIIITAENDGVKGKGQYVGTYMAWRVNDNCWWGEGEIKFYMDGDKEYPTICGTGAEDYFCGSYNFENPKTRQYQEFTTPYAGMHQVIRPDRLYRAVTAFGLYRWHILDPIRFDKNLKVTIQDLGWRHDGRYNNQKSDISSTTFWYQTEPHAKFPALPSKDELEIPRW